MLKEDEEECKYCGVVGDCDCEVKGEVKEKKSTVW
jgi:hypothetical protein